MHVYFVTTQRHIQTLFLAYFDGFARKFNPSRFELSYDPAGQHKIVDYRLLWHPADMDSVRVEIGVSVIHLASKGDPFHFMLDRELSGLWYLTQATQGEIYSEITQMQMLLPQTLPRQPGLIQGVVCLKEAGIDLVPEDMKAISAALKFPLYVEEAPHIPELCKHLILQTVQVSAKRQNRDRLKNPFSLPI